MVNRIEGLTPNNEYDYPALKQYSPTWNELETSLNNAYLHGQVLDHFTNMFATPNFAGNVVEKLDQTMFSLVKNFDDDELELRKQERYTELVVDAKGDEAYAKQVMNSEQSAFDEKKDFSQLLTDVALNNKSANGDIATQKYAVALSKDWIKAGYNDLIAQNRADIPDTISFTIGNYQGETRDGSDEDQHVAKYTEQVTEEMNTAINAMKEGKAGFIFGGAVAVLGVISLASIPILGIALILIGAYLAYSQNKKNQGIVEGKQKTKDDYTKNIEAGSIAIRQIMAEVVDLRREMRKADAHSKDVIAFLEQLSSDQYINNVAGNVRRVHVGE